MKLENFKTPCFVIDEHALEENVKLFQKALNENFKKSLIGYSYKTNSLPYIIKKMKEMGCYAEVVSDTEYELALEIGYDKEHIIFNGPIKGEKCFKDAITSGSIVNIDSNRELRWLEECSKSNKEIKIGLRVNFNLDKILPGETSAKEEGARFGFNYETKQLEKTIRQIEQLGNVKIVGLHMHTSTQSHSQNIYKELTKKACEIAKEYGLFLEYIDIGGSFFGGGDGGKQYAMYCETISNVLTEFEMDDICLIVEPGASVIANPISFLTQVIDVKETDMNKFVVTNGSRVNVDPFMRKEKYVYEVFSKSDKIEDQQVICGYTCMEMDRLMTVKNEKKLSEDDYILYKIVGSYTMCFNPLFIEYFPNVYVINGDDEPRLVRGKWSVKEYCQKCL